MSNTLKDDPFYKPGPESPAWLAAMGEADAAAEAHLEYAEFLQRKKLRFEACGFECGELLPNLFDFQRDIVRWGLRKGRAAFFEDCGLGKTIQQIEWARRVTERTGRRALIFAPPAVAIQTRDEGDKFGIPVTLAETQQDLRDGINITNYEKLHHFSPDGISAVVLDESSILKGFDGKTRKRLTAFAEPVPYRLCCTATPAPNDYMELGNHAEFLGVMTLAEMLATFFVHDGGDTSKWRLKKHAVKEYFRWLCTWAVAIRRPSDLGYPDDDFVLKPLRMHQITVPADLPEEGLLFAVEAKTLEERRRARRASIGKRVAACAELVNESLDQWIVWCNLNVESEALADEILLSVQVTGSDSDAHKETAAIGFARGEIMRMVSKPLIFGWGMNWQACHKVAFVGLSDSYEQLYQAIRRCWRFGQKHPVDCYIVTAETEGAVVRNIERKEKQYTEMMEGMVEHMKSEMQREIRGERDEEPTQERREESGENWRMILGDCVEETNALEPESVDYSIFSPPFASLYTYSRSDRDMGNSRDYSEFAEHFRFLVRDLYRVMKSGRLLSFHCMNLPTSKQHHGYIGIQDFRGDLIRWFQEAGFIYHSEVVIWKDPVTAMQRTKALGLLYKQLRKDSCMSRQGIPDYLVTMRKPGENLERVTKTHDGFPVGKWQEYASPVWEIGGESIGLFDLIDRNVYDRLSDVAKMEVLRTAQSQAERVILRPYPRPVWMDINPSKTLQKESAREHDDERHICPLQLEVIERAIELWTNPGDLVLSPFAGIGSEGYMALQAGRRFVGIELKESYFVQAVANLKIAHESQQGLFAGPADPPSQT